MLKDRNIATDNRMQKPGWFFYRYENYLRQVKVERFNQKRKEARKLALWLEQNHPEVTLPDQISPALLVQYLKTPCSFVAVTVYLVWLFRTGATPINLGFVVDCLLRFNKGLTPAQESLVAQKLEQMVQKRKAAGKSTSSKTLHLLTGVARREAVNPPTPSDRARRMLGQRAGKASALARAKNNPLSMQENMRILAMKRWHPEETNPLLSN